MNKNTYLLWGMVLIICFSSGHLCAEDALQILPTRIVLSNQSSAELTLVNKGTNKGVYRILLRNIRTDDKGTFSVAENEQDGELFADMIVWFSPRRVTIEPGAYQKVRIMVRKPKDFPVGEYRTHMVFQSLPEQKTNVLDETVAGNVGVSVKPIIEVSIPIIIRNGRLGVDIDIADIALKDNRIEFTIKREGNRSVYGDAEIFINSGPLKDTRVGYVRGLSVYYPNPLRHLSIPLNLSDGYSIGSEEMLIRYTEDPAYGGSASSSVTYTSK